MKQENQELPFVPAAASELPALLDVRQLRVAFGGKDVVRGIDFSIAPGEKVALVGESGSGKTVTALSLLRLLPDARVDGVAEFALPPDLRDAPPGPADLLHIPPQELRALRGRDIAMIFQEPMTALNPLFTVGDQVCEVLELKFGLDRREAWRQAVQLLADTGIDEPERRASAFPHQLSGGQRQRAMIAMALACQPRLLLADEPTTALDVALRAQILDLLDRLQQRNGMAVLMITHDLHLVRRFAQRVIVMENGRVVEHGPVERVFSQPSHPYTRRLVDSRPERALANEAVAEDAPVQLEARNLWVSYPTPLPGLRGWFGKGEYVAVRRAALRLQAGQTLGVIGESGSGKSTLAMAVLGLQPCTGALHVMGRNWSGHTTQDRSLRQMVQVVFQDPFSSLSPRLTVEELVGEGLFIHAPELPLPQRRERVLRALGEVGLDETQFPGLLHRYPHEFSGGQRQRLAIARALVVEPRLLVLDEPTSALDVTIQKQVLQLLQQLQCERGLAYLLITHDVDVIRAMAHEVLVMRHGEIVESGSLAEVLDAPRHPYTMSLVQASA